MGCRGEVEVGGGGGGWSYLTGGPGHDPLKTGQLVGIGGGECLEQDYKYVPAAHPGFMCTALERRD